MSGMEAAPLAGDAENELALSSITVEADCKSKDRVPPPDGCKVTPSKEGDLHDIDSEKAGGIVSGLLRAAVCRRRAPTSVAREVKDAAPRGFRDLVLLGRKIAAGKDRADYARMAWWSNATTKGVGARIFVIAPRGPDGDLEYQVDMWKLLAYAVSEMHDHVVDQDQPYAIVWVQLSDHRIWSLSALQFKGTLHAKYGANLDAVHVVHPSWAVRGLRLALWPIASEEFWDLFHSHERIEFLDSYVNLKKLDLPGDLYEYDKFLDQYAQQQCEEATAHLGKSGMFQ